LQSTRLRDWGDPILVWLMGVLSSLHHAVFRLSRPSPILSLVSTMNEARPCDVVFPLPHIRRSNGQRPVFFAANVTAGTLVKEVGSMAFIEYLLCLSGTSLRLPSDNDRQLSHRKVSMREKARDYPGLVSVNYCAASKKRY